MAHFAELNDNNYVLRIVRVGNDIQTSNGPLEQNNMHPDGEAWCVKFFNGGRWKQTSFNNNFRNMFANVGGLYDPVNDEFLPPKIYASWVLSSNRRGWEAPIEPPPIEGQTVGGFNPLVSWDESNLRWIGTPDNGQTRYQWDPVNKNWTII
jgi:hypothetical protein